MPATAFMADPGVAGYPIDRSLSQISHEGSPRGLPIELDRVLARLSRPSISEILDSIPRLDDDVPVSA
jgi:hypothetical protein